MKAYDWLERAAKAIEGLDPERITCVYIDRDGYEIDYRDDPTPDEQARLDEIPSVEDVNGRIMVVRVRSKDSDWQ